MNVWRRAAIATVLLSAVLLRAAAQSRDATPAPIPQTRTLTGRVLTEQAGDAIANARVTLSPSGQGTPVVLSGRDGRFTLTAPLSRVTVAANKSGYSRREVTVAADDESIEIRLARGAAVSGHVVDEFGDPVVGARVSAETVKAGKKVATIAAADTDDRGEYRLGGLGSEAIVIAAATRGALVRMDLGGGNVAMTPSTNTAYYPDSDTPGGAQALRLRAGEERASLDFAVTTRFPDASGDSIMLDSNGAGFVVTRAETSAEPAPTGVIRGRVVSTDGRPVPRAQVRLIAMPSPNAATIPTAARPLATNTVVTADDDGRFEFQEVAAGSFRLAANKTGYSMPGLSTFGPPSSIAVPPFDLKEGETFERADVTLARWGSIEGHVFDELGEPLQGVSVQLMQVRYQGGRRRLVGAGSGPHPTDDRGRFRLYGFPPGQYIVSATIGEVGSADLPGYTRAYYPGTPDAAEAQFVSAALSQDLTGVDFSMSRSQTARISGTLLGPDGEPTMGGSLRLVTSRRSTSAVSMSVGARIGNNGRFEFPNVPAGQYVIQADRGRRTSSIEGEFGALPVSVDGTDISGLILQTSAGSAIAGRVTFENFRGVKPPRPAQIQIQPTPVDSDQSPTRPADAAIHDDWSFDISGINGPRRLRLLRAPVGWTLKDIRVHGIDVSDQTLSFGRENQSLTDVEVTLTDRINELTGAIVDEHGRPAPASHVIVFSSDRDRWYPTSRFVRQAIARADGTIALAGLPPGSYFAAAIAKLPTDGEEAWQDPAYLESLVANATAFTLGEGQQHVLNLKLP
jgi:protocatechuate 3,4-dioxygenase beta subunit